MKTDIEKKPKKIVFAGNPNVGKSVFFNRFTGNYVDISNYPGTTVDITKAEMDGNDIIDTPGIYGIGSYNDEETVAKNIILEADIVINIVSAISLERDLFLTQQLIDYGFPLVVAVNQTDEAKSRGINIDFKTLEEMLGVKVIPTIAIKNQGIDEVKNSIKQEIQLSKMMLPLLEKTLISLSPENRIKAVIELEENPDTKEKIYSSRREYVNSVFDRVVSKTDKGINISTFIGKQLLNPFWGSLSAAAILYILYKLVGVLVAGDVVDFLENGILLKYYIPLITRIVENFHFGTIANQILVGEFGLLTMTVQYIIGVLLPLILSFYIFMSVLEDSGYLPRLAVLTDRGLSKIGLNGRAIIPIILGFGCITMATITTRILGTRRERIITTALLGLVIPCSAQIGVILGLMALAGGIKAWIIYLISIFTIFVITGTALNLLLPGKSSYLLIDLPPMRLPSMKNVLKKTLSKTGHFLHEATPLFFLGTVIISTLQLTGGINVIENMLSPLTVSLLHLPPETAKIFIMGLIRRDFGAAGLAQMAGVGGIPAVLDHTQILVCLIVLTLFVPCIASVIVMFKERGFKEASLIWLGSWVLAFLAGGLMSYILMVTNYLK